MFIGHKSSISIGSIGHSKVRLDILPILLPHGKLMTFSANLYEPFPRWDLMRSWECWCWTFNVHWKSHVLMDPMDIKKCPMDTLLVGLIYTKLLHSMQGGPIDGFVCNDNTRWRMCYTRRNNLFCQIFCVI